MRKKMVSTDTTLIKRTTKKNTAFEQTEVEEEKN